MPGAVPRYRPGRLRLEKLGRSVELAANIFIFAEQLQPERFPLSHVYTAQHGLINSVIAITESIFERAATGIEVPAPRQ
jgi:hypothetical protein